MSVDKSGDPLVVVTGGAGFIGSNMIRCLNDYGITKIIVVDDLTDGRKFTNLRGLQFSSYIDKDEFLDWFENEGIYYEDPMDNPHSDVVELTRFEEGFEMGEFESNISCVIHLGAISSTSEWDGKKMMDQNYKYTTDLMHICQYGKIPFIYASSASVYGNSKDGREDPLNVYAFSKLCIDNYMMKFISNSTLLKEEISSLFGLRFFNVYGPNENHKGSQASPVSKWHKQWKAGEQVEVFRELAHRDFVHVDDVCEVIYWLVTNLSGVGLFDIGTGEARSFFELRDILKEETHASCSWNEPLLASLVPMPDKFKGHYQYHTKANLDALRAAGCDYRFMSLEEGIKRFTAAKESENV